MLLEGVRCRNGDDGDGSESGDATVDGDSAPPSPCLWQSAKRQTVASAGSDGDKDNTDGNRGNNPHVVPLDRFFGAPTFSLSTLMAKRKQSEDAQTPVMVQQSSSVAGAKDVLLLADLETEMAHEQQQQSYSPVSPICSSPAAPQVFATASPDSSPPQLQPVPIQASRVPASRSFGNSSALMNHVFYPFIDLFEACWTLPDNACMQNPQANRMR